MANLFSTMLMSPFNFRRLPALVQWLDIADPNGNGILPSNASSLSTITDKSTKVNNATQASGSSQAVFNLNQVNGRPALTFTATKNMSFTLNGFPSGSSAVTIFLVVRSTSAATFQSLYGYGNNATSQYFNLDYNQSPTKLYVDCGSKGIFGNTTLLDSTTYIFEFNYPGTGLLSTASLKVNGVNQTINIATDTTPNIVLNNGQLCQAMFTANNGLIGQFCESVTCATSLSSTLETWARRALGAKWGVSV